MIFGAEDTWVYFGLPKSVLRTLIVSDCSPHAMLIGHSHDVPYSPTEILQLDPVSKELQELQEAQTLFSVTEDFFLCGLEGERRYDKQRRLFAIHTPTSPGVWRGGKEKN